MNHPSDSAAIEEHLQQWVTETCHHPPNSLKRRQSFNRLIAAVHKSGKLWRENTPDYEEALQQTWVYLYRNLCEACTGQKYDPAKGRLTTWLNGYLKRRLQDCLIAAQKEQQQQRRVNLGPSDSLDDPLDNLPAAPDIPPILEETRQWAETDPEGILSQIHIKKRPDITAQLLILKRLPPEMGWEALAAELNCPHSTLASFYQKKCFPLLRKFGEEQGYLS